MNGNIGPKFARRLQAAINYVRSYNATGTRIPGQLYVKQPGNATADNEHSLPRL
jgi:hypothetical protein